MNLSRISLLVILSAASQSASAFTFDSIQIWAGTGTNRAAFIVDWRDGKSPESLVWGYRWSGTATGEDMLRAIDAADSRFTAILQTFSFGNAVRGYTYDLNGDGSLDSGDHSAEGFGGPGEAGYWSYYLGTLNGSSLSWTSAQTGASGRLLTNDAIDGWSWLDNGGTDLPPRDPVAAVPEPASLAALALGVLALLRRRRA